MNNFTSVNFLTPIHINLSDICKLKTFAWAQYLAKQNLINVPFYNKDEYYISYKETLKYVKLYSLEIDLKKINYYKLVLNIYDNYFVFKILIDTQYKNNEQEVNNYTFEKNDSKNVFIYPTVIYFLEKTKQEYIDKYLIYRLCINIKCLFKMEIEINKIILITEKKYKKMISNSYSEYTTQTMNKNKTTYDDITFFFFFHPELMSDKKIYGFEFHNSNSNNLKDLDIVLKIPKKN